MVGELHISRSMKKLLRKQKYRVTVNHAFKDVIAACAIRDEGTWILPEVREGIRHFMSRGSLILLRRGMVKNWLAACMA